MSPLGHQEAHELAQELLRLSQNDSTIELRHVVSSPYIRCLETAHVVAKAFDIQIQVEPGLAEVGSTGTSFGSQEELELQYAFSSRIDTTYAPVMLRKDLPRLEYGDGAAARRAHAVAQTVLKDNRLNDNGRGSVLFVGHGATCLGLLTAFGAPEEYIGYASLTHFRRRRAESKSTCSDRGNKNTHEHTSTQGWELTGSLGEVSHLSNPQVALDSAW